MWWEKNFSENSPVHYADIPMWQKFCQNHSNLLHFWDKHVFAFYAEIQDSRQKCRVNDFGENSLVDSAHNVGIKNFVKIALSLSVSKINMFYAEIQDGRQKWWGNVFCEKTPIEYAGTLWVKNFVEKFLACFVSKINTFYAEIQDGRQKWWEKDFGKDLNRLQKHCGSKISSKSL